MNLAKYASAERRAGGPVRLAALALLALLTLIAPTLAQDSGPATRWFEVDGLNEGLGPVPEGLDRETPQSLVEEFLALAGSDDPAELARAAHLLDLREFEPDRQATLGPVLAGQLHAVMSRKVWIDWNELPDRPDGLSARGGDSDATAGEPRRSLRLARLQLDDRPVPVRINRIKAGDGDPAWVFSRQTVENVPALFELYGPSRFERAIPDALKSKVVLGLAWWELVALPLIVGLAVLAGVLTWRAVRALGNRASGSLVGDVLDGAAMPLAFVAAALLGFWVTSSLFTFSAPIDAFLAPALTALVVIAVFLIVVHTVDLVLEYMLADDVEDLEKPENDDRRRFQTNLSAARRIGLVIAFVAAVGLILTQANLFGGLGLALLGSAGLVTLILAYAGRTALSNIMASLQIAFSKSARVGDAVLWEGHWCYVEKINFTYVQLKSWDQRRLIAPVTDFTSETFENWTKRDPSLIKTVELRLNHATDVDALRAHFLQWIEARDDVMSKEEAKVQVIGHDASGMELRFYATSADPSTAWGMHCALREEMLRYATKLDPKAEHGGLVLPAEREVKVADHTGREREWREAAE